MATSLSVQSDPIIIKRLSELRSVLLDGMKHYGEVAFSVANKTFQKTILALEEQSSQYLNEINLQIEAMGGKKKSIAIQKKLNLNSVAERKSGNDHPEKQALQISKKIESSVIRLYGKILQEPIENESIKKMIQNQMLGIMRRTLQLKLLSKFLHNQ